MSDFKLNVLGYEQLTGIAASKALQSIPTGANRALIRCNTQAVRWRGDGTAPTAALGMRMDTTDAPLYYEGNLANLRFIETAATATVDIIYAS